MAACSDIRVNKEMRSIEVTTRTILAENSIGKASDCVNGTWLEDLGVTDYNTITKKYLQHRYNHRQKRVLKSLAFRRGVCLTFAKNFWKIWHSTQK